MKNWWLVLFVLWCGGHSIATVGKASGPNEKVRPILNMVGYSHLDTQWLWTYQKTLADFLPRTVQDTLPHFKEFPNYRFNFTGSFRYRLLQNHFPQLFSEVRSAVHRGRWVLAGSSVDEADLLIPSPESLIRQVLYGRLYFSEEFGQGTAGTDFLAPDAFGFPAHLPTTLSHAGVSGFSTQKLSWGLSIPKPFDVGVWKGPDGSQMLSVFSPGAYTSEVKIPPHLNERWKSRLFRFADRYLFPFDFRYFGVGDQGGSPSRQSIANVLQSHGHENNSWRVRSSRSDQFFEDARHATQNLPTYQGQLLLTEHSAGTLTSNAWSKKWNRAVEDLGFAAEVAAAMAQSLSVSPYPTQHLRRAWELILASQMHDILPGTSIPSAYLHSHNDQFLALTLFSQSLEASVGAVAQSLPQSSEHRLLVLNTLPIARREFARFPRSEIEGASSFCLHNAAGEALRHQVLTGHQYAADEVWFEVEVPPLSLVEVVVLRGTSCSQQNIELGRSTSREGQNLTLKWQSEVEWLPFWGAEPLLSESPRFSLHHEHPSTYPAWNMDWNDRRRPPMRWAGSSRRDADWVGPLVQGALLQHELGASRVVERVLLRPDLQAVVLDHWVLWRSAHKSLKLNFQFPSAADRVFAGGGIGFLDTPVNSRKLYEFPFHRWIQAHMPKKGSPGVSIVNNEKYGFDRPSANAVRLTALYSPKTVRGGKHYHSTQDFGRHHMATAVMARGLADSVAERLAKPLLVFSQKTAADEVLARRTSSMPSAMGSVSFWKGELPDSLELQALKLKERQSEGSKGEFVVRLRNRRETPVSLVLSELFRAREVTTVVRCDGQERALDQSPQAEKGSWERESLALLPFGLATLCVSVRGVSPTGIEEEVRGARLVRGGESLASQLGSAQLCAFRSGCFRKQEWKNAWNHTSVWPRWDLLRENPDMRGLEVSHDPLALPKNPQQKKWLEMALVAETETEGVFEFFDAEGKPLSRRSGPLVTLSAWHGLLAKTDERVWDWNAEVDGVSPGYARRHKLLWLGESRLVREKGEEALWQHPSALPDEVDPYHRSFVQSLTVAVPKGAVSLRFRSHFPSGSGLYLLGARWRDRELPRLISEEAGVSLLNHGELIHSSNRHVFQREAFASDVPQGLRSRLISPDGSAAKPPSLCHVDEVATQSEPESLRVGPASRFEVEIQKKMPKKSSPSPPPLCARFSKPVKQIQAWSAPCRVSQGLGGFGSRFFGVVRYTTAQGQRHFTNVDGFGLPSGSEKILEVKANEGIEEVCFFATNEKDGFNLQGVWGQ